ncbi:flavin reductase family protein [Mycolicibacterium phocaicum]|uniref:flavin reductase family protein n=1 Tax=Mycolicibacterium phocaicum TaxID=319706 RepID=UPI001CF93C98|nr:flavin reductase family protein [Mycolicibacterium phocaicum]UCZ61202.1 flavin reductase family protein [Mycolicibacterium phocaicum]
MLFDIDAMAAKPRYNLLSSLIVPRPIAWVTTVDAAGRVNAAPFSFFNLMSGTPPVVVLGIGNRDGAPKDTARNIVDTGEFVINLVTAELLDAMNITAIDFDAGVDEIGEAGLETVASHAVAPPRIAGSPVALECNFTQTVGLGQGRNMVVGAASYAHVRDDIVIDVDRGHIDAARLAVVARMHGGGWYTTVSPFRLDRITLGDRQSQSPAEATGALT